MVNILKFKGKEDEEISVIVAESYIEITIISEDCTQAVALRPKEWDRIARFVEVARRKKNAEVHD